MATNILVEIKQTKYESSFRSRLYGIPDSPMTTREPWHSPFTGRLLASYIHRCKRSNPSMRKVLHLLRRDESELTADKPETIDYVYFQEMHLQQVNELLSRTFWEGINVSDALLAPDYTIVALYRRLVVGVGLMNSDGYISYITVRSGWDDDGIGTFMLQHLISKALQVPCDVTLHVSITNPALVIKL
jgi:hypothetical protein